MKSPFPGRLIISIDRGRLDDLFTILGSRKTLLLMHEMSRVGTVEFKRKIWQHRNFAVLSLYTDSHRHHISVSQQYHIKNAEREYAKKMSPAVERFT
jgi:hypothetical protein